jgi:hypothetical protein
VHHLPNTPNVGNQSVGAPLDIGIADAIAGHQ